MNARETISFFVGCLVGVALTLAAGLAGFAFFTSHVWRDAAARLAQHKQQKATSHPEVAAPGTKASFDGKLRALDGTPSSLESLHGKVAVLNFWATWCGPCRREMPSLQKLYDETRGKGVVFALVSDEDPETIKSFLSKNAYTLPVFVSDGAMPAVFDGEGIPRTFILARDGTIAKSEMGSRDWDDDETRALLDQLLARSSPEPAATK